MTVLQWRCVGAELVNHPLCEAAGKRLIEKLDKTNVPAASFQ